MAKSKANTKVTARGTAVKGSRKGSAEPAAAMADNPAEPAPGRARGTKQALVLGLLQRKHGASLAELVAATSWLPHRPGRRSRAFGRAATISRRRSGIRARRLTGSSPPAWLARARPPDHGGHRQPNRCHRERDRASARSRPRRPAGALAQPDREGGAVESAEKPAATGARLSGPGSRARRPR